MTKPAAGPIGVLIVDDDPLVRTGLVTMLGGVPDLRILADVGDGSEVPRSIDRHAPDVVLMDIRMPVVDGLTATEALRSRDEPPEVIILTTFDADDHVLQALRAGAAGFLLKDTPPDEIVTAIRRVARGHSVLSPAVLDRLIARVVDTEPDRRQRQATERLAVLSERELAVAIAVAQGKSNAEIAAGLHLGLPTVKTHISAVLAKLGFNNRVQIALLVHDAGTWTTGPPTM